MPGIVGIVSCIAPEVASAAVNKMVESIRHESFYATGVVSDSAMGVYAGWVAQEGSFSDGMPVRNETGDVRLIFSGQEYPEPGIKLTLKAQGHSFDTDGPSYLIHRYEEESGFPLGLNGLFHGLVIDRRTGTATLFNDRYGMHPLYFYESKGAFYFAAEIKAILAACPELRSADPQSLGEFVACGCVLEGRTIIRGINMLPAGSAWTFREGRIGQKKTYFCPSEWENQPPLEHRAYEERLRNVLSFNLPRYFSGEERIGMTLTGGLDTRAIMAWYKPGPGTLPCYTFGGMRRDCEDVKIARRVALACQQRHSILAVGSEFLSHFPDYANRTMYFTEGRADVSRSSDLYLSEKARAVAHVKVVGTYGSEIVRHDVTFKPVLPMPGLYAPDFLMQVFRSEGTYAAIRKAHPVTFAAFRQSPWYHQGILALEGSQLSVRSPYLDNDFVQTVFRAPRNNGSSDVRLRLVAEGNPSLSRIRTDRGVSAGGAYGTGRICRVLLELTAKAEYAYDYGMPHWLARLDHAFSSCHFERLFLGRHKFLHYRIWYRDVLAEYVREVLLDSLTLSRPYLERRGIVNVVNSHIRGTRNYTREIHRLLSLELLHRMFLDPQ